MRIRIMIDDLSGHQIAQFLEEHVNEMRAISPPESTHVLDLEGLRGPTITFWTVWDSQTLIGCGALKELDRQHAEIKSMRISPQHRRMGIASMLLGHLTAEAVRQLMEGVL